MRLVAVIVASLTALPSTGRAQDRSQPRPCVEDQSQLTEPILKPTDEASRRSDFVQFRSRLQDAVRRRDEAGVLASVHPNVRTSFGDSGGIQAFKKEHIDGTDEDFWQEFATILRLGGRFRMPDAFDAPYTFSAWPEGLDSFECAAVIGSRVRVRATPGPGGNVITHLDYAIVQVIDDRTRTPGWTRVRLADGRTGYVAARYVRRPIDHRALFQFEKGRWWLAAYVAGD
jgi:hypothetical protein